ncbi:helix-turn-helix transcriptional regulator, partial [Conexibacter sp. JD483]|uniref:helix-turn-helix transcriptional regulator n=2 Tax=Conexibacter TaxID=191494 RepID=UPI0028702E4B
AGGATAAREPLAPLAAPVLDDLLARSAPPHADRHQLARIAELSAGNPLFALELLRALPRPAAGPHRGATGAIRGATGAIRGAAAAVDGAPAEFPPTLRDLVAARLAGVAPAVEEVLLAAAALASPTLPTLTAALGVQAPDLVARAVAAGLLTRDGVRLSFTHPLLAEGVLARAPAGRRRAIHRRLAAVVDDVEDRARQLALGAVLPDALPALEQAAERTRGRGAPAAAAELLELALELGGDPRMRVAAAGHRLDAGDLARAETLLRVAVASPLDDGTRARALLLLAELRSRDNSFEEALALLDPAGAAAAPDSPQQVEVAIQRSWVQYQRDERAASGAAAHAAVALAERCGDDHLLATALGAAALVDFALGRGVDEPALRRALQLDDPARRTPLIYRAPLTVAFTLVHSGRLDEAAPLYAQLARELRERGEEHDLAWLLTRQSWLECWRGRLAVAERMVAESERRMALLDSDAGRLLALTARAQVDAFAGCEASARAAAEEALTLARAIDWVGAAAWQQSTLGALELSAGNSEAAAERLAPFAARALARGLPEPAADGVLVHGDAAEALILTGRVAEAEPLVALLEARGAALDRVWAIAVGARCRALIAASEGDLATAEAALERALAAHARLSMPIERGRTLLVLGRVQRRGRRRGAARATHTRASELFEGAGARMWAAQAREELAALGLTAAAPGQLTASEERVARLAAAGLTNRQVADRLQISRKTVEAHLGRAYRKLDVHSRAELGARVAAGEL